MSSEDKKFFGVIAGSMLVSLVIISVLVANSGAYNLTPAEKNIGADYVD